MNSQFWKSVFDNLDEDIVNSAAERFGKADYSCENPESYSADDSPTVYSGSERRGKSGLRYFIAIGSAVAAVVAGVFILRSSWGILNIAQPLSSMESTSEDSSAPGKPVDYVEGKNNDPRVEISEKLKVGGFNTHIFEAYFYGSWVDAEGKNVLNLGYSQSDLFSHYNGRTVVRMANNADGGYMLAISDYGNDLYYVLEENPNILYYYQSIPLSESELTDNLWDILTFDHNFTEVYNFAGAVPDDSCLGYFGIEKLAEEMGVTAEWLLNQDIQFEGGEAQLWTRSVLLSDLDTVILLDQSENSVTLRMKYALEYDVNEQRFFDVSFEREDSGKWDIGLIQSIEMLYFNTQKELAEGITKDGLKLFKQHFTGIWSSTEDSTKKLNLIYINDIFTPAEPCTGIAEVSGGWAMCHRTADGYKVYYIAEDDPYTMYLYVPDENGFAAKNECMEMYSSGYGKDYSIGVYYSWMGLERYKLMHDENPKGISLAEAIDDVLNDYTAETEWSASFYTSDMEGWDGYRIVEKSDSLVLFSFQKFNQEGESIWVTQELVKQGESWTSGESSEGVLTDADKTASEEIDIVTITWSEDWDETISESAGEYDG